MMKESVFMCDSTEGNGKAEIVMDYVMSYSLRHAENKYLIEKPMLWRYCRYMLSTLLGVPINDKTNVKSVQVWREWQYMDLCVEAIIDGHKYALLIENKYYSALRENQLVDYKQKFDAFYDIRGDVSKDNRRYKLVSCHETEDMKAIYEKEVNKTKSGEEKGFEMLSFYDLLPKAFLHDNDLYEDTESEIFNEFWLRHW